MTTKATTEILRRERIVLKAARRCASIGLEPATNDSQEVRFEKAIRRLAQAAFRLVQPVLPKKRAAKARKLP